MSTAVVCTFGGFGPLRQQVKASEGNREAGGLHSWRLLGTSPQLTAELGDAAQGGTVLVVHPEQGHQEGHERAEDDAQQRGPSSQEAPAGVTAQRHSRHDGSASNPPSSGDAAPHM